MEEMVRFQFDINLLKSIRWVVFLISKLSFEAPCLGIHLSFCLTVTLKQMGMCLKIANYCSSF